MSILILRTTPADIRWTVRGIEADLAPTDCIIGRNEVDQGESAVRRILALLRGEYVEGGKLAGEPLALPQAVAIHVPYGGRVFDRPVIADPNVIAQLESLLDEEPVHLPLIIKLILECAHELEGVPIVLAFDTAFFVQLPAPEHSYAVGRVVTESMPVRRFGHHGLYHEAASRTLGEQAGGAARRVLSICLEPRPEVAAIMNGTPLTVTGGETPLEGLPGERSCGDIDPSIVFTLAREKHWGIEQVNDVLTRRSGLLGLCGRPMSIRQALVGEHDECASARLASRILCYRLQLACGAAVAIMGGLDAIVYSGSYYEVGHTIGGRLNTLLRCRRAGVTTKARSYCYRPLLSDILADCAHRTLAGDASSVHGQMAGDRIATSALLPID